jgi:ABC-type transporter Mla maintaining outer membrane lipid asymmetry ATPase subunit MlaF
MGTAPPSLVPPTAGAPAPGAGSAAAAIEMIDVTVPALREPERAVLTGVNWSVQPGEFWTVGGLHATGKSDLMAVAAGILQPLSGTYRAFGQAPGAGYEQERLGLRLRVGLVFDGGNLLNHLTVAENVALPIRYHRDCRFADCAEFVEALLETTGLRPWADFFPGAISRNWQQRAGLARALALKPEVLLLDSPLSGLDPRDAAWWLDLAGQLAAGHPLLGQRPLTLVVTGDDFRPWRGRARRFAVLQEGRFVQLEAGVNPDEAFLRDVMGWGLPGPNG